MNRKRALLVFALLAVMCGCAGLTPAQKTLWALNVYQAQYDLYLDQVIAPDVTAEQRSIFKENPSLITGSSINPNLTDDQRKVLRVKKQILIELKPLVLIAAEYQRTGQLPPAEVQAKLTELINRLVAIAEDNE